MDEQKIRERIRNTIEALGGRRAIADVAGVRYQTAQEWYNGRMSTGFLKAIHVADPSISLNWLLFGDGPEKVEDSSKRKEALDAISEIINTL